MEMSDRRHSDLAATQISPERSARLEAASAMAGNKLFSQPVEDRGETQAQQPPTQIGLQAPRAGTQTYQTPSLQGRDVLSGGLAECAPPLPRSRKEARDGRDGLRLPGSRADELARLEQRRNRWAPESDTDQLLDAQVRALNRYEGELTDARSLEMRVCESRLESRRRWRQGWWPEEQTSVAADTKPPDLRY